MAIFQCFPGLINLSFELSSIIKATGSFCAQDIHRRMHAYAIVRSMREIAISIARVWYLMDFEGAFTVMHIRVERERDGDA